MREELLHGDALQQLKTLQENSIDVGVTSPPYNKQENKRGYLVSNVKYDVATDKLPENEYQEQQVNILNELYRVIKPGGSFFYNHKLRWERGELLHPMMWLAKTDWTKHCSDATNQCKHIRMFHIRKCLGEHGFGVRK